MINNGKENDEASESKVPESPSVLSSENTMDTAIAQPPYRPPPPLQLNQDFNILSAIVQDTTLASNTHTEIPQSESKESFGSPIPSEDIPPKIHARKKSADKAAEKRSSLSGMETSQKSLVPNQDISLDETVSSTLSSSQSESMLVDNEQKISVKERKQMFNRMASESDVLKSNKLSGTSMNVSISF